MPASDHHLGEVTAKIMANFKEREAMKTEEQTTPVPEQSTIGRRVHERLARKFGYGTDENRRRNLYERLEHEVEVHGDVVYVIISDVVQAAQSARSPSRWFCKSVILRLRERGYLQQGDNADW